MADFGSRVRLALAPWVLVAFAACAPVMAAGGPAVSGDPALAAAFDDPRLQHAFVGVLIRSLDTGEVLFSRDADRLFVPASNMKVVTAAAALSTLGPDFQFATEVAAGGPIRNGVLDGSLIVTGTGDPTFSGNFYEDPRDVFVQWADSLRALGVTRILGGVVGVDTAFTDPTLGAGWMWDDLVYSSSAEYGALQFNDGAITLDVFPSSTNLQPGIVVLSPPSQYVRVINDTRTMPDGSITSIRVDRDEASATLTVRGEIAADDDGYSRTVSVRDPTLFLASTLRETLREQGITVEGPAARHTELGIINPIFANATHLFTHRSPRLGEIVRVMLKESQNQISETMVLTMGREFRGFGTAAAGVAVVDSMIDVWGIEAGQRMNMVDGSGLSRYDLISPALLVGILETMDASPYRDEWLAALPIAGEDGTLANRMRDPPLAGQVRAKTGTMTGIRSLSGYLTTASGRRAVFSTMVNNSVAGSAAADDVVEAALRLIAQTY